MRNFEQTPLLWSMHCTYVETFANWIKLAELHIRRTGIRVQRPYYREIACISTYHDNSVFQLPSIVFCGLFNE